MKVLIADDDKSSIKMLEMFLTKKDYEVLSVQNGIDAWNVLQEDDELKLAIFDWEMPGYNGVQLCRMLSEKENQNFVYTILLTSKREKAHVVEGLDSGASDFLTKPVDLNELTSRLSVGVRIANYENDIIEKSRQIGLYASQMERLAEQRAKQLVHADRMATLGMMSAGIAHEINNPTSFISGNVQTLKKFWEHIKTVLENKDNNLSKNIETKKFILQEMPGILQGIQTGVLRITNIVKGLNTYARQDSGEKKLASLNDIINMALDLCHNVLKYNIKIEKNFSDTLPDVLVDIQQMEQVFINLFVNAAHAMENSEKKVISIQSVALSSWVCCKVVDTGPGIPREIAEKIWNPFFTTKEIGKGTGLGLSICQRIVENQGGDISVDKRSDHGGRFFIRLPIPSKMD